MTDRFWYPFEESVRTANRQLPWPPTLSTDTLGKIANQPNKEAA